ncbi:transposase [Streptomyces sp. NBC_00335]|uniref:transposase n=1 Tax=unclassified Streptomyces TaxID=2593676 RepID=UPI00225595F6|nr:MULTISPECIES: transposase [unclassified Streptomyces]MCX5409706.1 transposase [Streptomyces sp. NBC_00086]
MKHRLVFIDRLLATLVHLRRGVTHDVLVCWFGVDRSTITRAIGEARPLLATRGCTVAAVVRLRSLAEVIDHLGGSGQTGIIDGTEIRVRRPAAGRKDREKFISGKNKQNAVKVMVLADAGYQGLGAQTGGRVVTPSHRKFKKNPPEWYEEIYERQRKAHSSRRIRVEHGIAHLKNWRSLAWHLGRREHMSDTIQAVAGLPSHQQTATRGAGQPQ